MLEAIGDGNFLEKYEPFLNLDVFCLSLSEMNFEDDAEFLAKRLDEAYLSAYKHFFYHPELSQAALLQKIDAQLKYSSSLAASDLIEDTLGRYRKYIIDDFNWVNQSISHHLAWDVVCGFPFAYLEGVPKKEQAFYRK